MHARFATAVALSALSVACAGRARVTGGDRNIITADEIATVQVTTAYDIVARLRSEFLQSRGTVTRTRGLTTEKNITQETPAVTAFVDGVEAGPVTSALPLIPASEVQEIRLYRAADAATKYGSRHTGGVIAVTTKRANRN